MRSSFSVLAGIALATSVSATDLDWSVQSGGQSTIAVAPGETIPFELVAELTDVLNLGLAGFSVDLIYDGGDLVPVDTPTSAPMNGFASPLGLSNPDGFGGTVVGGDLLQVGGIQNTIANFLGIAPTGAVTTNVAITGSAQVLAMGELTAPETPGTYLLSIANPMANVIRAGETGFPFWASDEASTGSVTDLTIDVEPFLSASPSQLSLGTGGTQTLLLNAGSAHAGRPYLVLGSISGTAPGITVPPVTLPLNFDFYMQISLTGPNLPPFTNTFGPLDGFGKATAAFTLPTGLGPAFLGLEVNHAFVLLAPEDFASNAAPLLLQP